MVLAKVSKGYKGFVQVIGTVSLGLLGVFLGTTGQVQAAVINSVQRGMATFASGQNTLPVTLTAVDPTKTIVWGGINWGGGRFDNADPNATRVGFDLASSSTLNLER